MASLSGVSEKGTKLLFEVLTRVDPGVSSPRLGRLSLPGRKDLLTPDFFAVGSRGVVPHITPDMISSSTQFGGVHMALEDCTFPNNLPRATSILTLIQSSKEQQRTSRR